MTSHFLIKRPYLAFCQVSQGHLARILCLMIWSLYDHKWSCQVNRKLTVTAAFQHVNWFICIVSKSSWNSGNVVIIMQKFQKINMLWHHLTHNPLLQGIMKGILVNLIYQKCPVESIFLLISVLTMVLSSLVKCW